MCGILVEFSANRISNLERFQSALSEIHHRGPDGYGIFMNNENKITSVQNDDFSTPVLLGHKRLSIIDLSAGNQPMVDSTGRYVIVFNGEIFNFRKLRQELIDSYQLSFNTHADTEVLLYGLIKEGISFLERCNGMWAFALYDLDKNSILLSRDRYGIKPLYFWSDSKTIVFSSEIKPLLKYDVGKPNERMLDFFIKTGVSNFSEETFFDKIYQVEPGGAMSASIHNGCINTEKWIWYNLKHYDNSTLSNGECLDKYQSLIKNSVKLRLESDVEIGSLLSGGIDSSIIVKNALLSSNQNLFQTFSGISSNKAFDETKWVNAIVDSDKRIVNHKIQLEDKVTADEIDAIIRVQECPFSTSSIVSQNRLFRSISKYNLKVILDGQGSDELNLGYDKYFKYAFLQMLSDGKLNQCFKYTSNLFSYHSPSHAIIFILNSFSPQILSDFFRRLFGFSRVSDLSELVYISNNMSLFEFESLLIQKIMLPNHLLYLDKNSMNYSIEARSPFLDHNIVEFSLSLSASQRLVKGRRKGLLLDSMQGLLPKSIYERKNKLGFKSDDNQILNDIGTTHTNFRTYTIERWRKIYFGA